jgi:hypothetical protein
VSRPAREGAITPLLALWLALSAAAFALATPNVDKPGLYYDEAFLAQQARGFVEPERAGQHPPSTREIDLAGRPFPLRNAAYLGSLKSQLLIPSLALFGSSTQVLRLTTLATGLLGLLFAMLWARQLLGTPGAMLGGLLVATDPGFLLFSQYEWGPYTTMLLCRSLGFFLLTLGLGGRRPPGVTSSPRAGRTRDWLKGGATLGGAAALGLGVYSRADFVLILAAAGVALALCWRDELLRTLREAWRLVLAGLVVFLLAASPMLLALRALLSTSADLAERGSIDYRARVLWSVLDGSYFHRLMELGGRFEAIFEVSAPASPFGVVVIASALILCVLALLEKRRQRGSASPGALVFLPILCVLLASAMLLLPGAVRAHHMLNLHPFVQMMVAAAALALWRREWRSTRSQTAVRATVAASLALLVVCNLVVVARTDSLVNRSGGRGRWSDALPRFALELEGHADANPSTVVSLDWGFHEPLLFLTDRTLLLEPIWALPRALQRGRPWAHQGDAQTVYLVHDTPYDLFGLGPSLLTTARALPPEQVEIRPHRDREGEISFLSVRFLGPHQLLYTGRFSLRFL